MPASERGGITNVDWWRVGCPYRRVVVRVWVAGARGETHIHRGLPSLTTGLESCGEIGIDEECGPHSRLILDVLDDILDLGTILAAQLMLNISHGASCG